MYPVATRSDIVTFVSGRFDGSIGSNELKVTYRGDEFADHFDVVEGTLEDVLREWRARDVSGYRSDQSRDEMEGELSAILHAGLSHLPAAVLTDRDFWRFCAGHLYDFVVWRQPSKTVMAQLPYFGAASNGLGRECVPHRMFDRAQIARVGGVSVGDEHPYALAQFGAADVWKSHILRVANGNAPLVVREMLLEVQGGRLKTDVVRPFVKNLRRIRANVMFEVLDRYQARELVDREIQRTVAASPALDTSTSDV